MPPTTQRPDHPAAALGAVVRQLREGVRVADVRCGDGMALLALARSFPRSTFHGFGVDAVAVGAARRATAEAGLSARVTFEVAPPGAVPAPGFDLLVDADRLVAFAARLRPDHGGAGVEAEGRSSR